MDCKEAGSFIPFYVDGELEPPEVFALEAHVARCPECSRSFDAQSRARSLIRCRLFEAQQHVSAPAGLCERVEAAMVVSRARGRGYRAVPVVAACVGLAAFAWTQYDGAESGGLPVDHVVVDHSRNLPPEVTFASDGRSGVRRFLSQHLSHPPVRFPTAVRQTRLVGARLSSLGPAAGAEGAYVIMDHQGARVSFFAYPTARALRAPPEFLSKEYDGRWVRVGKRRGYNVVNWDDGSFSYALVSDIDPDQMLHLASTVSAD